MTEAVNIFHSPFVRMRMMDWFYSLDELMTNRLWTENWSDIKLTNQLIDWLMAFLKMWRFTVYLCYLLENNKSLPLGA